MHHLWLQHPACMKHTRQQVSFPITFTALFRTGACDNGCENGSLSCIGKIVFSLVLITIVLISSYYAFRMYVVLKSDDKFNLMEFLFPCWTSTPAEGDRSRVLTASQVANNSSFSSSTSSCHGGETSKEGDDQGQKVVWDRIRKIWKIVFLSVITSILVIYDNFSYCSGRSTPLHQFEIIT